MGIEGYRVDLVDDATAVTGSIAKIIGLEYTNTVDNITFGRFVNGGDAAEQTKNIYSNIADDFVLPKGAVIDGPIYAFKSANATGKFLVYYNI